MLHVWAVQLLGSEGSHKIINNLKRNFIDNENENYNGLLPALNLLRSTDLRTLVSKVKIPTLIISGGKDKLTPYEASLWMRKRMKNSKIANIKTASHIPFISNKNQVLNLISDFLETDNGR